MNPQFAADLITDNGGMNGFDDTGPPWLMVPLAGINYVRLVHGDGLKVVSTAPASVTVKEVAGAPHFRRFEVAGLQKGNFFVDARGPVLSRFGPVDYPIASLHVGVKAPLIKRIAFKKVEDSATPPHKSRREQKDVDEMLQVANNMYFRQANIMFSQHGKLEIAKVGVDLGSAVYNTHAARHPPVVEEWDVVVAQGDPTADFNVFFVWKYRQTGAPQAEAAATRGGRNLLIQDHIHGAKAGLVLAHEVGHLFDLGHRKGKKRVMDPYESNRHTKFSQEEIDKMNP